MTDIPLLCPVEPHEMSKPMRRGFEDIVRRVTVSAAAHGWGNDLLLRIYTAGIFHGVELHKRTAIAAAARSDETLQAAQSEGPQSVIAQTPFTPV